MKTLALVLVLLIGCGHKHTPEVTPDATPEALARELVTKLAAGDSTGAVAHFDATMLRLSPADKTQAFWASLVAEGGPFERIVTTTIKPHGDHQLVLVSVKFAKGPMTLQVSIDATGHVAGLFVVDRLPATYDKPDSYDEAPVKVGELPGTLSRPHGAGPFPALVLVHGSGPSDADETIGGIKVFRDLAHGLASRGIAVLRYEKRTHVAPIGVVTQHDEVDVAAHAAVALLAATPGIDPKRIVLLGHSQGGFLAPRIATDDPAIRALVILAGPTRTMQDTVLAQMKYLSSLAPDDKRLAALVPAAEAFKRQLDDPKLAPGDAVAFPGGGTLTGAYFLDVAGYHPEQVAAKLSIPIAVLQGGRDYQVTLADDFPAWQAALPHATFFTYPELGHPFVPGTGSGSPKDYLAPAHVDAKVIDDLARWISALPK